MTFDSAQGVGELAWGNGGEEPGRERVEEEEGPGSVAAVVVAETTVSSPSVQSSLSPNNTKREKNVEGGSFGEAYALCTHFKPKHETQALVNLSRHCTIHAWSTHSLYSPSSL